jgi:hypothetical protein
MLDKVRVRAADHDVRVIGIAVLLCHWHSLSINPVFVLGLGNKTSLTLTIISPIATLYQPKDPDVNHGMILHV